MTTLTEKQVADLRAIFDRGLCAGSGSASSRVCIEAAICLVTDPDKGLSDSPSCVAAEDRKYAIRINDASWSSPEARANALWPLALAQIGTAGKDRSAWVKRLVEGTIRRVLPMVLEVAAERCPGHAEALRAAAVRCRDEGTREAAIAARDAAAAAAAHAAHAAHAAYAAALADAAAHAAAHAAHAAYAVAAYTSAAAAFATANAAYAAYATANAILRESVAVALDAYAAEEGA